MAEKKATSGDPGPKVRAKHSEAGEACGPSRSLSEAEQSPAFWTVRAAVFQHRTTSR